MTQDREELKRLAEAATQGEWHRCTHLQSAEKDTACPCGYRGGIWSVDLDVILLEMGGPTTPGEEGLDAPRAPRSVELANAAFIEAVRPDAVLSLLSDLEAMQEENAALKVRVARWEPSIMVSSASSSRSKEPEA